MKAKDLMIGDWVYNPFTRKKLRLTFGRDIDLAEELCLEPIPLTAEILEKNGFDMDDYTVHFKEDEHYMLELVFEDDELKWTINCNEYTIMNFEYVHELQHALRLCGIEKEIIL